MLVLLAAFSPGNAEAKPIRLRHEIITPESPAQKAKAARTAARPENDDREASGLFLIQLNGAAKAAWREELRERGVELLCYVPDDAYVARLNKTKPGQIRGLDFVRWAGEYKADYKLHSRLIAARTNTPSGALEVAVLISPGVGEAEASQARRAFQSVRQESRSRLGRVIRGRLTTAQLETLARSDSVLWIEPAPRMKLFDEGSSKIVAGDGGLNVLHSQSLGYDGAGVKVAVADTGLNNGDAATMHPDLLGRTPAFFYYGSLTDAADQHGHGTHVAGIIAGSGAAGETDIYGVLYGLGVAPGASIIAQRMFDATGGYEPPPTFEKLTSDATSAGADIGSNSWGEDTQGNYDLNAMEFDALVRDANTNAPGDQPYILVFAAGNAGPGPQTIASPAVAKNVIAAGASQSGRTNFFNYKDGTNAMTDFSSRGPCEDGRIKPDLVAPGTWIASLLSRSALDVDAWGGISTNYMYGGGTSQSGPHVAGAAAVFVDYYRQTQTNATPSPALVKAALINSALDMNDPLQTTTVPNNDEGWGRVDLIPILDSNRDFGFVDQTALLTNGQTFVWKILVAGSDQPLKVTLAYTDVPGFPGAIPALVNDLDLEIITPDGQSYHGNQFVGGESVAGASGWDRINNVEGVFISAPSPGYYTVCVHATNVVEDARYFDTPTVADQDFALVCSANLAAPGESVVVFDRPAYTAPGTMKIAVIDPDITGSPSVTVLVRSTSEPAGENYVLMTNNVTGTFTGSVATVTGTAIVDGKLQIAHGNTIEAIYFDSSADSNHTATALADLMPPILSGVNITNQFGHTFVTWISDELANSTVLYNTNQTLTRAAMDAAFVTQHSVALDGLVSGTNYYFLVFSTDQAGNTVINDNGGQLFSFVAAPPATVLLVDAFNFDLYNNLPPLDGYTEALDELDVSYEIWNTTSGSPTLADLLAHRVVIWRLPEFGGTWSAAEQNTIANYVASGGSLFVASMQVLTRLDAAGYGAFRKNTLRVNAYDADVSVPEIAGASNDPLGNGISVPLDYTIYENQSKIDAGVPADVSDAIVPATSASPAYYNDAGEVCGLRFPRIGQDSQGRVVFLSIPLDAAPMTEDATNNRAHLLGNVLRFLAPGFDGCATIALNSAAYTIPSQVTVEVDEPDLSGAGSLNVNFSSTTQTNATALTLLETLRDGTFRGFITLVHATNPAAPETLRVQNGDTVSADYFDSSAGETATASAVVDTQPPIITNVAAQPDYVRATITWLTDKPCDALVQYGESPLSFRTAYEPTPTLAHQITLQHLNPNTLYYFRVVSRDAADNATTDDNDGAYHTFTTLLPLAPPWFDDLDGSAPGWVVVNTATTQSHWTRGLPNNGSVTNGYSAPNAWGSNLNGDSLDEADTYLISPAVQLIGGDTAKLTFWHNYDFSDQSGFDAYQEGRLYVITNDLNSAVELDIYSGISTGSNGWKKTEVDLTPYMGKVVNIVWYYTLYSSPNPAPRPGWLVDDVSITVSNTPSGTIEITNNIWQARFVLNGPAFRNGKGTWAVVTNAPLGQYTVEFASVAYYQTPSPQTNQLSSGGQTNLFQGNYTFADVNTNGISDEWELHHFGQVSTNRTGFTDTDGDGMADLGEFLAGTDPNGPLPPFQVTARLTTNGMVELEWPSAPGHSYRIHVSTNFTDWTPDSGWIAATGPSTNSIISPTLNGMFQFFRVEATDVAAQMAASLRVTPQLLPGGSLLLDWNSTLDRVYRVHGSGDAVSWTPYSGWIQAVSATTSYVIPPLTNDAPFLFRVEVQP